MARNTTIRAELLRLIDDMQGDSPRLALAAVRALRGEMAWLEQRAVAMARRDGYDWGKIGRLLGISRQAARQRFAAIPALPPPRAVDITGQREREIADVKRRARAARECDGDPVAW
ncbi:MAG: hypothetical protein WCO88_08360 [Actinomycetota bacterium]|jgi:hypothetical protein